MDEYYRHSEHKIPPRIDFYVKRVKCTQIFFLILLNTINFQQNEVKWFRLVFTAVTVGKEVKHLIL